MSDPTAGPESESPPATDPAPAPAPAPAEKVAVRPALSRRRRVTLVLLSLFTALALGIAAFEAIKTVQTWPAPVEMTIDPLLWEPELDGGLGGGFNWLPAAPLGAEQADREGSGVDVPASPGGSSLLPRSEAMAENPLNLQPPPGSTGRYAFRRVTPPWIEEVVSWSNTEQTVEQAASHLASQLAKVGFVEAGRQQLAGRNLALRYEPVGLNTSGSPGVNTQLAGQLDRALVQLHFAEQDGRIRIMILFRYVMR